MISNAAKERELFKAQGPVYPALGASIAKSRALAWKDPDQRGNHGMKVLGAINELNRAALRRALGPVQKPNCASGTFHLGDDLLKAIRQQTKVFQTREYEFPLIMRGDPPYKRGDNVWTHRCEALYAAAMAAKLQVTQ